MSIVTLDDRDPSIVYSNGWGHGGSKHEFDDTTTWSDVAGQTAQLTFQGSSVAVYGTIPKQGFNSIAPVSSYSIDGGAPVEFRAVEDNEIQYSQQFFQSPILSSGTHMLTITNDLNSDPLYLDFLKVNTAPATSSLPSTPAPPSPSTSLSPSTSPSFSPSPSPPPSSPSSLPSSSSSSLSTSLSSASSSSTFASPSTPTSVSGSSNFPYAITVVGQSTPSIISNDQSSTAASSSTADSASSSSGTSATSGVRATKKSNSGAVAGGVVGAIIVLILIVCGVIFWRRRQQKRRIRFRRNSFGKFISAKSDSFWGPVNDPSSQIGTTAQPFDLEAPPPPRPTQPTMTQAESAPTYPYTQPRYAGGYDPDATYNNTAYTNPAYATSVATVESSSEISYYGQEHAYLQDHAY